ncbi:hypothetical protein BVX98_04610 [bacterium F11]|nr:hypothetical protein BVX98_04610 [bacterium F11]
MINRMISLPSSTSFFLFGPRQTGKSTLVHSRFRQKIWEVNLLLSESFYRYAKEPGLFRLEALHQIEKNRVRSIFIDEVQRLPQLLNEVHYLIQNTRCQFILTGSSARKIKRGGANLLAGRAVERFLFPFVHQEIKDHFNLNEALLFGTLPSILGKSKEEKREILSAYVHTYLREEIQSEGIVRNLGGFSKFLDIAASQVGELINFSNIASESLLSTKTVQSYYEILEDTLIGIRLNPWRKSVRKRLSAQPKYYFADNGITNAILKRLTGGVDPVLKGKLFEQWIIYETNALLHYKKSEANLHFWRTNHGAEVDLIIEKHGKIRGAFEIKSTVRVTGSHLSGLRSFKSEHPDVPCHVIAQVPHPYELEDISILPWKTYLSHLSQYL